jgi:uncharacterized membrane protein YcaP (DUF421 family)
VAPFVILCFVLFLLLFLLLFMLRLVCAPRRADEAVPVLESKDKPEPVQIIDNGIILLHSIRQAGVTRTHLYDQLRRKGIQTADQVEFAFLDAAGDITFIEKVDGGRQTI